MTRDIILVVETNLKYLFVLSDTFRHYGGIMGFTGLEIHSQHIYRDRLFGYSTTLFQTQRIYL